MGKIFAQPNRLAPMQELSMPAPIQPALPVSWVMPYIALPAPSAYAAAEAKPALPVVLPALPSAAMPVVTSASEGYEALSKMNRGYARSAMHDAITDRMNAKCLRAFSGTVTLLAGAAEVLVTAPPLQQPVVQAAAALAAVFGAAGLASARHDVKVANAVIDDKAREYNAHKNDTATYASTRSMAHQVRHDRMRYLPAAVRNLVTAYGKLDDRLWGTAVGPVGERYMNRFGTRSAPPAPGK